VYVFPVLEQLIVLIHILLKRILGDGDRHMIKHDTKVGRGDSLIVHHPFLFEGSALHEE
jgi:hypothetical protein